MAGDLLTPQAIYDACKTISVHCFKKQKPEFNKIISVICRYFYRTFDGVLWGRLDLMESCLDAVDSNEVSISLRDELRIVIYSPKSTAAEQMLGHLIDHGMELRHRSTYEFSMTYYLSDTVRFLASTGVGAADEIIHSLRCFVGLE